MPALTPPHPPTPPHRAQPTLAQVSAERLPDYLRSVMRGFLETYHEDVPELDRQLFTPDRTFGHQVDDHWISTASDHARSMSLPGGELVDIAAVTNVTVSPSYRRRGLLREMMTHQLNQVHERGETMSLLWATESGIYGRFGYGPAVPTAYLKGATRALGFRPDVDLGGGSVAEVSKEHFLAYAPGLHAANLQDRPGALSRLDPWWEATLLDIERERQGASERRYLLHLDAGGDPTGYAMYRTKDGSGDDWPNSEIRVSEVNALDLTGHARLWRHLLDHDLVRSFSTMAAVDDPLPQLVADPRSVRTTVSDGTYLRLVDVRRALAARSYLLDTDLVLEVSDPLLPHNAGRWHLQAGPDGATVKKARRRPDLSLGVRELASVFLGGVRLSTLANAGLVTEHRSGAVAAGTLAFSWTRAPFTPDHF